MAYIKLKDGTRKIVPPDTALAVWQLMKGETDGTPRQKAYIKKVERVYLNWRTAPRSYLREREQIIRGMQFEDRANFNQQELWYENI